MKKLLLILQIFFLVIGIVALIFTGLLTPFVYGPLLLIGIIIMLIRRKIG